MKVLPLPLSPNTAMFCFCTFTAMVATLAAAMQSGLGGSARAP